MSLCIAEKASDPSLSFVYSLLGDGEPHVTGVGGPIVSERDESSQDLGRTTEKTPIRAEDTHGSGDPAENCSESCDTSAGNNTVVPEEIVVPHEQPSEPQPESKCDGEVTKEDVPVEDEKEAALDNSELASELENKAMDMPDAAEVDKLELFSTEVKQAEGEMQSTSLETNDNANEQNKENQRPQGVDGEECMHVLDLVAPAPTNEQDILNQRPLGVDGEECMHVLDLVSSAPTNEQDKSNQRPLGVDGEDCMHVLDLVSSAPTNEQDKPNQRPVGIDGEERMHVLDLVASAPANEQEKTNQRPVGIDGEEGMHVLDLVASAPTNEQDKPNQRPLEVGGEECIQVLDLLPLAPTNHNTNEQEKPNQRSLELDGEEYVQVLDLIAPAQFLDSEPLLVDVTVSDRVSVWPEPLQVEIPSDGQVFFQPTETSDCVSSEQDLLSPCVAQHNSSSDSSELYVTAANSEGYDSVASTTEGEQWSLDPPLQPDSLEETENKEFLSEDRSLPVFVPEVSGTLHSLPSRIPKKLFGEESDEGTSVQPHSLDVNLKDLEGRKLREMERERRRIIDNQTVRRKKIDYWAFASEDRHQGPVSPSSDPTTVPRPPSPATTTSSAPRASTEDGARGWPPTPPASPISRIPVMMLGRISPGSLPKGWSPAPPVVRSVSPPGAWTTTAQPKSPSPLLHSSPPPSKITESPPESPSESPLPWTSTPPLTESPRTSDSAGQSETQNSLDSLGSRGSVPSPILSEAKPEPSALDTCKSQVSVIDITPLPGSVDCASILENKERLRLFWERRIMAEQENVVSSPASEVPAAETVVEGNSVAEEPVVDATPPDSLNDETGDASNHLVSSSVDDESALDREVRLALEREQQLKQEQAERQEPESEPKPEEPSSTVEMVEEKPAEASETSPAPQEKTDPVEEQTTPTQEPDTTLVRDEGPAQPDTQTTEPVKDEPKAEPQEPAPEPSQESPEKGEDSAVSKPQVVGETYQVSTAGINAEPAAAPSSPQPVALPTPKAERPPFNPTADSKIAQEIMEMKAREEELRLMRENLQKQQTNGVKCLNGSSGLSDSGGSVHSDEGQAPCGRTSPRPAENVYTNGHQLVDSLQEQTVYNLGYAFGHRRKDGVKVKPLNDEPEKEIAQDGESFPVLKESPIEREIRLAHEREEELRKEKGLNTAGQPSVANDANKRPSSLHINGGGPWRGLANGGTKTGNMGDTQRFLATNRIQQEIVEQTEREMALRASGKIQTISQERTDAKVTRLRDVTSPAEKRALLLLSSSPPTSPALSSSASDSDKSGPAPTTNGVTNGHHPKTPSPSSSVSGGQVVQPQTNGGGRRFSNPPPVRGVSMQRFIASKGRELSFSAFGSKGQKSNSVLSLHSDPFKGQREGPRPVGPVGGTNGVPAGKRCVPAETKIQEELKEMQVREDELNSLNLSRQQRARLIGLSQPNLSILSSDEDLQVNNGHHPGNRDPKQMDVLDRAASNPNLLDEDQYDEDNEKISVGGPRRRSMLIDQWEKRIQKAEEVKAT